MTGMRLASKRVEDENIEILEQGDAFGRDVAHVGEIGGGTEAIAGDRLIPVGDGDSLEAGAKQVETGARSLIDAMKLNTGAGGITILGTEGVVEDAFDGTCRLIVGIEWQTLSYLKAERPQIVEAEDVIGVAVGVKNSVYVSDILADGLCMEVRAGIDQDNVTVIGKAQRGTGTAVAGIPGRRDRRGAYRTVAPERRDAH